MLLAESLLETPFSSLVVSTGQNVDRGADEPDLPFFTTPSCASFNLTIYTTTLPPAPLCADPGPYPIPLLTTNKTSLLGERVYLHYS